MKEIFLANIPASIATIGLMCYFLGMAITFVFFPKANAAKFAVQPTDNAGITEIRVYYGGISFALACILGFLASQGFPNFALICGLILANTVFFVRLIFTFVDKGWNCAYTKLALPCEGLFVIALWVCQILSNNL